MDQVCSMKNDPLQECARNAKDLIQNEIAHQITKFYTCIKNHLIFLTSIINMFTANSYITFSRTAIKDDSFKLISVATN